MGRQAPNTLKKIIAQHEHKIKIYVETGTLYGQQILYGADIFDTVYGIELDEYNFNKTKQNTSHKSNVTIIHGNTTNELPKLSSSLNEPCLFYLDAHYCILPMKINKSKFPLYEELQIIKNRKYSDIVIVDDVHTFGKNRDELRYKDEKEWENVTINKILLFMGERVKKSKIIGDGFVLWLK